MLGDPFRQVPHITARTHQEDRLGGLGGVLHCGHHGAEVVDGVLGTQRPGLDGDHRAVGGAHHRQRGVVALDEQQGGPRAAGPTAHRLGQRAGGVQLGHHHDVVDTAGPQSVPQPGAVGVIGPGDTDGSQLVRTFRGTLSGAQDGRDDLLGGIRIGVGRVGVQRDTVASGTLHQNHPYRCGCHRHTENDLHRASLLSA